MYDNLPPPPLSHPPLPVAYLPLPCSTLDILDPVSQCPTMVVTIHLVTASNIDHLVSALAPTNLNLILVNIFTSNLATSASFGTIY